ncbi:hypothetical protein BJY01DRAFT_255788 [Aspergillus pseudoustus]|uniref:Rhodopsin domain-containing protein n=1 Tax=Aspergillus pseudoustus TaxID=1810923 RepID=A0ABR4IHB1_9EURO
MAELAPVYSQEYLTESRQPLLLSVVILFIVVSTIAVLLRLASRKVGHIKWQLDDTLVILGWLTFNAFMGLTIADIRHGGVGLHQASVSTTALSNWAKFLLASSLVYIYAVGFPKLAIVVLYITSFSSHRASKIICYITGITLCVSIAANTAAGFAICRPLHALWDGGIAEHCFNINAWFRYGRVVNIVSDVVMLVLPVPHVVKLNLRPGVKLAVLATFLLGSVGLIASVIGFTRISTTNAVADNTWSAAQIFLWSTVEIGMYHVAACMIAYLPLARWIWDRIRPQPANADLNEASGVSEYMARRRVGVRTPMGDYEDYEMGFVVDPDAERGSGGSSEGSETYGSAEVIKVGRRVFVGHFERV